MDVDGVQKVKTMQKVDFKTYHFFKVLSWAFLVDVKIQTNTSK